MKKRKKISIILTVLMALNLLCIPMVSNAATSNAKLILKAPTTVSAGGTVNVDVYIDNTTTTGDTSGVCWAKVEIVYDANNFSIPLGINSTSIEKGADAPNAWSVQQFETTPGTNATAGHITLTIGDPNFTENIQTTNAEKHIARLIFTANSNIPSGTYNFTTNQDKVATGLTTCDAMLFAGDGTVPANFTMSYVDASTTVVTTYTVTFNSQGGTAVAAITGVTSGNTVTAPTAPTRTGYTFGGWYKEAACTNAWAFATDKVTAATTLYAKWTALPTYTVTYDANSGTGTVPTDSGTYYNGNPVTVQFTPEPTRTGYVFAGWATSATATSAEYTQDGTTSFAMGTAPVTLYAVWSEIDRAVTYNANGATSGSVPQDATPYSAGVTVTVLGNTGSMEKTGYTFTGWSTESAATEASYVAGDSLTAADRVTLYAVWVPYTYTSNGTAISLTGYTGTETVVTVPATIAKLPVTAIGSSVFAGKAVTAVTLPSSLTSMSNYAFQNCSALTSIAIPDGVTQLSNYLFAGCSELTTVSFGSNSQLTNIWTNAFNGCSALTAITIPDGVVGISNSAFEGCSSLQSITIPDKVTLLGERLFYGCSKLTTAHISTAATYLKGSMFEGCTSLTTITIPEKVASIGNRAFYGCTNLSEAKFAGNAPTTFGTEVFDAAATGFKVLYTYEKTGWTTPTWNGYAAYPYCTVTYDANSGTGTVPTDSGTYYSGNPVTVQFTPEPTRTGYVFAGWATSATAENAEYTQGGTASFTMGTEPVTLYAVWTSNALSYTGGTLTAGTSGTAYTASVATASNGTGTYTYATTSTLPTGLTLSSAGVLSGTPTSVGTYNIVVTATDSGSAKTANATFTLTINAAGTVAAPTASPASGAVEKATAVTLSTATSDATIYYTTDGTEPTTSSNVYSGAITINEAVTIKAIAVKAGYANSSVASFAYTITESGLSYTGGTLTAGTYGAAYTASVATASNGTGTYTYATTSTLPEGLTLASDGVISGTPTTAGTYSIEVTATDSGSAKTATATFTLTINAADTVAAPTASPVSGAVEKATTVTLGTATSDAMIYYTTDGTEPTTSSNVYSGAITINEAVTIKAIAVKAGYANSSVASFAYTITGSGLSYTGGTLTAGTSGTAYTASVATASNGTGTYTYATTSTLPTGLTLASDGVLSGTPTSTGTYSIAVTATDSGSGATATATFTLTINTSGSSSSGGSSGGSSSGSSTTVTTTTTPTTTVSGSTAITTLSCKISDGKATGTVTQSQISDAISKAQAAAKTTDEDPHVEIKLNNTSGASSVAATIPGASMQSLVSGNTGNLTFSSELASVTFDEDTLKTFSSTGSDISIMAAKADASALSDADRQQIGSRPVYQFSVTSGGQTISQFGGDATVFVPYTPASGEDLNAIVVYYINAQGKLETVTNGHYDAAAGGVVFNTNHFSTYAVGYNKVSFTDVSNTAWYSNAVNFIAAREITSGTTDTTFSPDASLTRGQFIALLLRAYGISADANSTENFSDAGDNYYTGYLAAAKRLNITSGIGDNKFAPDQAITRQEMFTMLHKALKTLDQMPESTSGKTHLSDFIDGGSVSAWAQDSVNELVNAGVVSGDNGMLNPDAPTTRAEFAQVLYKFTVK